MHELHTDFRNQDSFLSNVQRVHGANGWLWLTGLRAMIERFCRKRDLRFVREFPNLNFGYLAILESESGETFVLKANASSRAIRNEVFWLRSAEDVSPKVLAHEEAAGLFVMEYVKPGRQLAELTHAGEDELATRILCRTLAKIHTGTPVRVRGASWIRRVSELVGDLDRLVNVLDSDLINQARGLGRELCDGSEPEVRLHGDLHHHNILSHTKTGEDTPSSADEVTWKVIDPHFYLGPASFEIGAMIRNPVDFWKTRTSESEVRTHVDQRMSIACEELNGFDPHRLRAWAFVSTMLSMAWSVEDSKSHEPYLVPLAKALLARVR